MPVVAVVRVAPETGAPSPKPDPGRIALAADRLADLGFEVLHRGWFGVTLRAPAVLYQTVFGTVVQEGVGLVVEVAPRDSQLNGLVVGLEVAAPVQCFSSEHPAGQPAGR